MSRETAVVIDSGSGLMKAGFSGSQSPQLVFPSIVGHRRMQAGLNIKDFYVGDEAQKTRGLALKYPIEHGIIKDWDDMEKLWTYTFSGALKVDSTAHNVMLTERMQNPKSNSEKMVELMFEKFNVPASYVANQAALSLYGQGKITGLIIDSGDGVTDIVPIDEGYAISHNYVHRMNLGGRDITEYLARILTERGHYFTSTAEKEIVRDIKEKLSYTALDFASEMDLATKSDEMAENYELPDGQIIQVNSERIRCAEVLFQPHLIGMDSMGIAEAAHAATMKCDFNIRKVLFENIVLSGGNSMFPNIEQRLKQDVKAMVPESVVVDCIAPPERKYSAWIGGAILASLGSFSPMWIQRAEYDEIGSKVVHRKCF